MKSLLISVIAVSSWFYFPMVQAAEHHSGHGAGMTGGGGSASQCMKASLERFDPPHLAKVAPGSTFSFYAFNIDSPEQLSATVKKIPVALTAEYKDPYFLVKGKLPDSLVNTAARVQIKASAKSSHCEDEQGWLLMIGDKS